MKALLIDPYVLQYQPGQLTILDTPPIREIEVSGNIDDIYSALSSDQKDVTMFDVARLENGDVIYVDDEGLFGATHFFMVEGHTVALAGRGLVVGMDSEGSDTAPLTRLEDLWASTRISMANLEVRLSSVPVGAPATRDSLNVLGQSAARCWAMDFGFY